MLEYLIHILSIAFAVTTKVWLIRSKENVIPEDVVKVTD